ncbi:MAG: glycosyltransferase family 4 protein [Chloroflexota bacterium]
MQRIAMLGPFGLHPNKTMRSRALSLARELVKLGHLVTIIMPPWQTPEEANKAWTEDGVRLINVAVDGGIPAVVRRMLAEAERFKADIIYGFKPKAYSGLSMWWLWQVRRFGRHADRLLITDTDDWEGWGGWNDIGDYSTIQKYFFAWQERWGMTHCDHLIVASRELEKRATEMGIPAERLTYLINGPGIRVEQPFPPPERAQKRVELGLGENPTLLLYSRLFEFNTERLIITLIGLIQRVPDIKILMVGAGLFADQAKELRKQLAAANLLEACVDVGWLEEDQLPNTLRAADVALYLMDDTLLNRTKCPVKLADLVALGIPVVAEEVGQVSAYVVDGENGYLKPSGDTDGLIDRLAELLSITPEARQFIGAKGKALHQETFAWETQAQKFSALIEKEKAP